MKNIAIVIVCLFYGFSSSSQDTKIKKYAKMLNEQTVYAHLQVLTSDSLAGRGTGSVGHEKATRYLADQFKQYGLKAPFWNDSIGSSYFQSVPLYKTKVGEVYASKDTATWKNGEGCLYFGNATRQENSTISYVFIGNGKVNVSDRFSIENQWVVMTSTQLFGLQKTEWIKENKAKGIILIYGNQDNDMNQLVMRMGKMALQDQINLELSDELPVLLLPASSTQVLFQKPINELKAINNTQTFLENPLKGTMTLSADMKVESFYSQNVVGYIEGTDQKDEVIVISAHNDHLGEKDGAIYRGADDDGSGTSCLLSLAEAFSEAAKSGNRPRKSILFLSVTAEEIGLYGSEYYTQHPFFPLDKTMVNLNIDMIGRLDETHAKQPNYVYVIGADKISKELHLLHENINKQTENLILDYTYNSEKDPNRFYYRSDHYNFAKNNVPVIFYFTGTHEDYHKPSDTIEKIELSKITSIGRLVFYTAWELANRETPLKKN